MNVSDGTPTDEMFDPEWHLIGRVGDLIDEANADLPIEENQRIARGIIALVRSADAPPPGGIAE